MAFLDWINRRESAKPETPKAPGINAPSVKPETATPNRSTPDDIIADERAKSVSPQTPSNAITTPGGHPIIWQSETKLGRGKYLHTGRSAEGFHCAVEGSKDFYKPHQWGPAFSTSDEAKEAALKTPEQSKETPAANAPANQNERAESHLPARSRNGWER